MRKSVLALATMLAIATGGSAFAMYETGGITGINTEQRFITLDSRVTYTVLPKVNLSGLAIGDHIRFDTETRNGRTVIDKIIKGY